MRTFARVAFLVAAACGSVESTTSPSDGGIADVGTDAGVDASLVPNDVTKIVVREIGGGPLPDPPDGSTCRPANATYTIVLPSRVLSWKVCDWGDGGPQVFVTGEKTLSEAEYAAVDSALRAMRPTPAGTSCGFDKPVGSVVLTSPEGEVTYYDDFYACNGEPGKTYVTGFDELNGLMRQYAR